MAKKGVTHSLQEPTFFTYKGEILSDRRNRMEKENK